MIEVAYLHPNRSKKRHKPKKQWLSVMTMVGFVQHLPSYDFSKVHVRINGKVYTKNSKSFKDAHEKELIWNKLQKG